MASSEERREERQTGLYRQLKDMERTFVEDDGQTLRTPLLMACPFCGGEAFVQVMDCGVIDRGSVYDARVVCGECHVATSRESSCRTIYAPTGESLTRLDAISKAIGAWNTRAHGRDFPTALEGCADGR